MTPTLCEPHGLPAVCFGANFVGPKHRCPRCCRDRPQLGGIHGVDDYLGPHEASEGVTV